MARPACPDSRAAAFSRCGRYRWWLRRRWRDDAPTLLFLGLNPSSADGQQDDPTLRRLIGLADGWGYGTVEVLNLFAWISSDPAALRQAAEPVGHRTDAWIHRRVRQLAREAQALQVPAMGAPPLDSRDGCLQDPSGETAAIGESAALGAGADAALPLWLGWGNGGRWQGRDQQMLQLLGRLPVRLFCLGLTAAGQPRHPLYARAGSPLLPFGASWEHATAPIAAPCPALRAAMRST